MGFNVFSYKVDVGLYRAALTSDIAWFRDRLNNR